MEVIGIKTRLIKKKEPLTEHFPSHMQDGDILVISSKVVAVSQGRVVALSDVTSSPRAKLLAKKLHEDPRFIQLVLNESDMYAAGTMTLSFKEACLIPNAGIDRSNSPEGIVILWPTHPWKYAEHLWKDLKKRYNVKNLGVVIADSHCQPLRWGTTGLALAWAGFVGVQDERGKKDLYGKPLTITRKAVADNVASAAMLVMGEAAESTPIAVVRGAEVVFTTRTQKNATPPITPKECIFSGVYSEAFKKKFV